MKRLLIILIFIRISTCVFAESNKEIVIDFTQATEMEISLSTFVSKIEYIPLELTKECLLDKSWCIYVTPEYILTVRVFEHIYMFDRNDGHFIKEIGSKGGGPEDYFFTFPYHCFDYRRQIAFVDCIDRWKGIDVAKNKCVETIIKPHYRYQKENIYQGVVTNPYLCTEDAYVGYANNTTGSVKEKVVFFDKNGKVLKSYPNYSFEEVKNTDVTSYPGIFYEYDKNLCLLPGIYSDTVYTVNNFYLTPHIIFKWGENAHSKKYETINLAGTPYTYETNNDEIYISTIRETVRYVFFKLGKSSLYSCGYYDKQTKKVYHTPFVRENSGFINDIDGLLNFDLKQSLADNCLIDWLDAGELSERYESGKLKSLSERGKKIAKQIKFDDNPIVVIATLK